VPVFVSALLNEAHGFLHARLCVPPVSKLARMRTEAIAEHALLGRDVFRCFWLTYAKLRHSLASTGLSHAPRLFDSGLEVLA